MDNQVGMNKAAILVHCGAYGEFIALRLGG
jgi:hypothetical protein